MVPGVKQERRDVMPSQIQLYGEILDLETQFRADLAQVPRLTEEERQALLKRLRQGDMQARDAFVNSFLGYVVKVARKFTLQHQEHPHRVEFLDLVQMAMLAILERVDRALEHPCPIGYLNRVAECALLAYCQNHTSLIVLPHGHKRQELPVIPSISLENQTVDGDFPFEERLLTEVKVSEPERDFTPLYTALEKLTSNQREWITCLFGLGCAPETFTEIAVRRGVNKKSSTAKRKAIKRLEQLLEPYYASA